MIEDHADRCTPRTIPYNKRFNMHIQSKLLECTPVMGTHSSYELICVCWTEGYLFEEGRMNIII